MAASVKLSAEGLWSWIMGNPDLVRKERVVAALRKAQKQAITEWCALPAGPVGLAGRFIPSAFSTLGLTPRSQSYQKRQRKTLGAAIPYVGPLNRGKQLSPSGSMRRAVLSDGGHRITNKNNGGTVATTILSLGGARILNIGSSKNAAAYRREFLGLDRGGRRDVDWIVTRANDLASQFILREIQSARRIRLRDQAKAQAEYNEGAA